MQAPPFFVSFLKGFPYVSVRESGTLIEKVHGYSAHQVQSSVGCIYERCFCKATFRNGTKNLQVTIAFRFVKPSGIFQDFGIHVQAYL